MYVHAFRLVDDFVDLRDDELYVLLPLLRQLQQLVSRRHVPDRRLLDLRHDPFDALLNRSVNDLPR